MTPDPAPPQVQHEVTETPERIYRVMATRARDKNIAEKEKAAVLPESAPLFCVDVDVDFELSWPVALAGAFPEVSFCAQGWFQNMKGAAMKPGYAFFKKLRYFPSASP